MIKAVLWDMDGTLVDTESVIWAGIQRAFREAAGIELPEPMFQSLLGRSERDFYRQMSEHFQLSAAAVASIQAAFEAAYLPALASVEPLPGAVEKVREFAVYAPQALVTGSTGAQAAVVLHALNVADAFRHIVGCDRYQRGKPDPEPFLLAARLLDVEPASCLAIEDSLPGIAAARAAGMKVVGVHAGNGGRYDIAHADIELQTLHELDWQAIGTS